MNSDLTVSKGGIVPIVVKNGLGAVIKPLVEEILLDSSFIAGTNHIEDESVFENLEEGTPLILKREADNKFDEYAVLVLNEKHEKLGYIPRQNNKVYARLMDAGKVLKGKVLEVYEEGYYWTIKFDIYMMDF